MKQDDDHPNHALLLKTKAGRIVGTTLASAAIVAVALSAFDVLPPNRFTGTADANAPFSDWVPSSGLIVDDPHFALAAPVEAEVDVAASASVTIEAALAPSRSFEPEASPAPTPVSAPPVAPAAQPPVRYSAPVTLAAIAPTQDVPVGFEFGNVPNDAEDLTVETEEPVTSASIPLPRPAPERPPLPPTPADRLKLSEAGRAKAEKCLAQAIYFEARSESLRGQISVAQVVMNRVFSSFYPDDVCGVVYQNAHRRLACQFTFACDGIPERVTDRRSWRRAQHIAKRTLDGKIWVAEVAKSTHYHASYVRPRWTRAMKRLARYGRHTFYRPRRWGDGSQETDWSNISQLAASAIIVE